MIESKKETAERLLLTARFLELASNKSFMSGPEAAAIWKQQLKEAGYKEHPKPTVQKTATRKEDEA